MMATNEILIYIVKQIRIFLRQLYDKKSLTEITKCSVPKSFGSHFQTLLIFLVIVLSSGCVSGIAVLLVDTNSGYH